MVLKKAFLILVFSGVHVTKPAHGLLVPESAVFSSGQKNLPKNRPITFTQLTHKTVHDPYASVRDYFFWWRQLPTIGLQEDPDLGPTFYPFVPHFFSLQELAAESANTQPVTVGLIDNGTAHLTTAYLRAHPYIEQSVNYSVDYALEKNDESITVVPTYTTAQRLTRYADQELLYANHGTYCAGLIAGHTTTHSFGIAPLSQLSCYKIITSSCTKRNHNPLPLVQALEAVADAQLPIASVSYSIQLAGSYADRITAALKKIPFSCIAAGNNYTKQASASCKSNYLAEHPDTSFVVGSFGIQKASHKRYPISSFTTFNINTAHNFILLPGESILSCCYNPCITSSTTYFVFMQGTSVATPLCSGFLALVMSTLHPVLSYAQIKQLVLRCMVRLHNSADWRAHGILGTPDMRMTLFIGHVLSALKKTDKNFDTHFMNYLETTRSSLLTTINTYGKKQGVSHAFEDGMIDFLQKARQQPQAVLYTHKNLVHHVQEVAQTVRSLCTAHNKK